MPKGVIVILGTTERQENLLRVLRTRLPDRAVWTAAEADVDRNVGGAIFRAADSHTYSLFGSETGGSHVRDQR